MTESMEAMVVGPEDGRTVWFTGNRMTIKATGAQTGGAYGLIEALVAPGSSPPLHVHHREEEAFWILEGRVRVRCGDEELTIGPGSFIVLPRDVPHSFLVESDTPARWLNLLTPAGCEEFFVAAGRPAEGPGLPRPTEPDIPTLTRVGTEFGVDVVGPPMRR